MVLRGLSGLGVGGALVLVLAACASPVPQTQRPASTSSDGTPMGGTLSIAWDSDIRLLDPAQAYDSISQPAERLLFETLVTYDAGTKLVPLLASAMPTISADGRTYTFKLRSGVHFVAPDGTITGDVTASDVVDSINRMLDPHLKPSPSKSASGLFSVIAGASDVISGTITAASGIRAIDATTVDFELVHPDATFLNIMATPFASVLPAGTTRDGTVLAARPISTGPFLLTSYVKGQQATFTRNPHYWQPGRPYLDEIDFKVNVDDQAALQQIEANTLDLMGNQIPDGMFTSVTTDPQYASRVVHHSEVTTFYLFFDTQEQGPLGKPAVRAALEHAIDKDGILKLVHGAGVRADCIFPPDLPGFDPSCHPYTYDPSLARSMLAAAGYPNGFSTTLYTTNSDPDPITAEAIRQDLAKVGVTVDVKTEPQVSFFKRIGTPHQVPVGYVGWNMDYPDPSDFIDPILSCATAVQGGSNAAFYCNPQVDALAAAARANPDPASRLAAYQDIQRMVMADAPWVPLRFDEHYTLESSRVGGFTIHPVWQYDLGGLWIKPGT